MSLAWLLPIGFTALAAWLLPLLIHLARRSEHRITDFAALRWLSARPQPRRRIRLDEWPLLLLRLLLLAAIAALLARPALSGAPDQRPWVVAVPTLTAGQLRAAIGAGGNGEARMRWLLPGFPALQPGDTDASAQLSHSTTAPDRASVDSLLRELDATLPRGTPLTVLVPTTLDGAGAERVRLSRAVTWRVLPDAGGDSTSNTAAAMPSMPASIMVRHDPARADGLRYVRAAERAWRKTATPATQRDADASANSRVDAPAPAAAPLAALRIASADVPLDPDSDQLVWLVPGPLPPMVRDWIRAGGRALVVSGTTLPRPLLLGDSNGEWRDDDGSPLIRSTSFGRGRISQWTRPLSPDAMPQLLDVAFPTRLQALLSDAPPPPARVDARIHAPAADAMPFADAPRPLGGWLIAVIALLFGIERWMASSTRRGPTVA